MGEGASNGGQGVRDDESWRGGLLQIVGSAGLSLLVHSLILSLFALATWAVTTVLPGEFTEYRASVVKQAEKRSGPVGGYRFPGRAMADRPDSARAARESEVVEDLAGLLERQPKLKMSPVSTGTVGIETLSGSGLSRSDVVGAGMGGGRESGGSGSGLGDRDVAGGGPVGTLWGVGEGQRAQSIVYVMDRSGSMAEAFSLLQRELMRAIGTLDSEQMFNLIWFNEGKPTELAARLLAGTMDGKRDAFEAIKRIVPSGQTEPMEAIKKGLSYRPDVLFLLSDGDFGEENEKIIRMINQKNRQKRTTINTILFVYDTVGEGERVLRAIAEANGGVYKHVTEEEIRE